MRQIPRIGLLLVVLALFTQCEPEIFKTNEIPQPTDTTQTDSTDFPVANPDSTGQNNYSGPPPGWPWRGISVKSEINRDHVTPSSIQELSQMGVDLITLRLKIREYAIKNNMTAEQSIRNNFTWAEKVIKWSKNSNINVVVCAGHYPFNPNIPYNDHSAKFWNSEKNLSTTLENIERIVKHFNDFDNVVGYAFIMEPVITDGHGWSKRPPNRVKFFKRVINSVRKFSNKYILYAPGPWGLPKGYDNNMEGKKFKDDRIIYSFHYYAPTTYTHQGIGGRSKGYTYPGQMKNGYWDKSRLERGIRKAVEWAQQNDVKYMMLEEFSVVNWAPNDEKYLRDLLDIIEKNNISWTYFSFNSWRGWDYHYKYDKSSGKLIKVKNSDREKLLKKYWSRNFND